MRRIAAALAILVSLLAIYALAGFYGAPLLIQRSIETYADEALERKATVGKVRVNPFLLRLELKDFALVERDGAAILGFGRLFVDLEISSLARRAWTFASVALERPALNAEVRPDGRLNLALLIEKLARKEPRPDERLPRLLLHRATIYAGTATFSDRSGPEPESTAVRPINLELRDFSTLPDHRGEYTVSARLVDGGSLNWRGDVSLEPLASQGEVRFTGMKPLTLWRFLRDELAVEEPRGEVDYSARYRVAYAKGVPQVALDDVKLAGRDFVIVATGAKTPLFSLSSLAAEGGRFDLATREFVFPRIEARDGAVAIAVDKSGAIDWEKLIKPGRPVPQPRPDAGAPRAPWKVKVEALHVAGIAVGYVDESRKRPIRLEAENATIDLSAAVELQPDGAQALLERVAVSLAKPAIGEAGAKEPLAQLDTIALEGGSLNLDERQVAVGRVAIKGGLFKVARDRNGAVGLVDLIATPDAGLLRREVGGAVKEARAEGRPWRVAVDGIELAGTRVALSDESLGQPVAYDAEVLLARVGEYRSDGKGPIALETRIRLLQGGSLAAKGVLRSSGDEFAGQVKLEGFNLKPLRPALLKRVPPELVSGEVSMDLKTDYRARGGRREFRASGVVRVDNLQVNETQSEERLLGWQTLTASGVNLSLVPDALKIEEVRIVGLNAKVIVFKDRSVNLAKAVKLESPPPAAGAAPAGATQPATIADVEALFPVTVGRVTLEQGRVDFADLSLVLPFAAVVQEVSGVAQGLSTDRASRATVRMEGRVDEYGLARVNGSLSPFRPTSFLDLNVNFRNVDLPPLSPYSATFAGRRIASGRLALDLQYKINDKQLAGENRVVLEKFTLGERVEAPGALSLPLDLAVALLTDSDGKIDIAVPVRGNVDDPQFSYGQVIWQAISNLLTRIVTAPFRALAALFGGSGGAEQLEDIAFDLGRAVLLPPEREKLKRVAEGLAKRPQLRIVAEGQYGSGDRAALQQREVEAATAAALGRAPAAGKPTDPIEVTDAKTQRALEALYVQRNSEQGLAEFAAQTGKTRGKPVDRVNAALALLGRGSPDREFYEALLKRLNETAPVPDAALAELAAERARSVTEHLTGTLAVAPERTAARTAAAPGSALVKLALDVARAPAPDKGAGAQ
jgi:hypothetical protein